jgi:hypothetical protein
MKSCPQCLGSRQTRSDANDPLPSILLAGPSLQNSFECEVFEPFAHPLGPLVDVTDDHSERLSNSGALGVACSEVVAGEVMHRPYNAETFGLSQAIVFRCIHQVSAPRHHFIGGNISRLGRCDALLGEQREARRNADRVSFPHAIPHGPKW